jgi:hypothetical protein
MLNLLANQTEFDNLFKLITTLGGLGAFLWTVYTWRDKSRKELEASAAETMRTNLTRTVEATKPFLERQLQLYTDATRAAAVIATTEDEHELGSAVERFMQLYSGELALVENEELAKAMKDFRHGVRGILATATISGEADLAVSAPRELVHQEAPIKQEPYAREGMQMLSLNLAHACRKSLAKSWHVDTRLNRVFASISFAAAGTYCDCGA